MSQTPDKLKAMIKRNTLKFLKDLKLNNSKEWMEQHRETYESTKEDILAAAGELLTSFWDIDHGVANAELDPKKCITRLNRDLRFTKDRTPYKTDYYLVFNKDGKNSAAAFYYLHVEPGNCFVGAGVYNPEPVELKKIRYRIATAYEEWTGIINDKAFKKQFPTGIHHSGVLSRTPKDFEEANPADEFLKMKGFYTMEKLTEKEITTQDTSARIISCFKTAKPLVDFLNRAMGSH